MFIPRIHRALLVGALGCLLSGPTTVWAGPPQDKVEAALDDLIGESPAEPTAADDWREHLDPDALRAELAKGPKADPAAVGRLLGRLAGHTDGMKRPAVARLRMAIEDWLGVFPPPPADRLSEACREAKGVYIPRTEADVRSARSRLAAAVARLDARLDAAGPEADDWRTFLMWDELAGQLDADAELDVDVLKEIHLRYSSGHEGLGLIWFADVRRALLHYQDTVGSLDNPQRKAQYERLMDALPERLEAYRRDPTAEDARKIRDVLRWLARTGQARRLIRGVRHHLNRPNFYAQVSAPMVEAAVSRPVDDTMPVRDVILGTDIYGTGHTVGQVSGELVPSEDKAQLRLVMRATTDSDTIGYNGPVRIYSTGTVQFVTQKTLFLDDRHVWALPAESEAQLETKINRIRAKRGCRLVERLARRSSARKKPEADRIATRHAEERSNERVDEEAGGFVQRLNDALTGGFRKPLEDRGLLPEPLAFRSTKAALHVTALHAGPYDLSAPGDPPPVEGSPDVSIRIHESLINNLAAGALSGMIFDETRLRAGVADLLGPPAEPSEEDEDEPLGITFSSPSSSPAREPISVTFDDNRLSLTVRGDRYVRGEREYDEGMDVTITYRIEPTDAGFKAVRDGDVQIYPAGFTPGGGRRLTVAQLTLRRVLRRKLANTLADELVPQPIVFSDRWSHLGELALIHCQTTDGWLLLSFRRVPPAT